VLGALRGIRERAGGGVRSLEEEQRGGKIDAEPTIHRKQTSHKGGRGDAPNKIAIKKKGRKESHRAVSEAAQESVTELL